MTDSRNQWTLLVYRIPSQPTRLRLQIWRKLQRMGALYLQDAVCLLPSRPDLDENMEYIASAIEEMGGTCHLFSASAVLPGDSDSLAGEFRVQADSRLNEIIQRLDNIHAALKSAATPLDAEQAEGDLKRERVTYLRARKLSYFGSAHEAEVNQQLDKLKSTLDVLHGNEK